MSFEQITLVARCITRHKISNIELLLSPLTGGTDNKKTKPKGHKHKQKGTKEERAVQRGQKLEAQSLLAGIPVRTKKA